MLIFLTYLNCKIKENKFSSQKFYRINVCFISTNLIKNLIFNFLNDFFLFCTKKFIFKKIIFLPKGNQILKYCEHLKPLALKQ